MLKFRQINIPRKEQFLVMIPRDQLKEVLARGLNLKPNDSITMVHPDNFSHVSAMLKEHEHVAVLTVDKIDAKLFKTKVRTMNPTAWRVELRSDGFIQYMGLIQAKQITLHSVTSRADVVDKHWTGL